MATAEAVATGAMFDVTCHLPSDLQHNTLIESERERMLKVQYVQASR